MSCPTNYACAWSGPPSGSSRVRGCCMDLGREDSALCAGLGAAFGEPGVRCEPRPSIDYGSQTGLRCSTGPSTLECRLGGATTRCPAVWTRRNDAGRNEYHDGCCYLAGAPAEPRCGVATVDRTCVAIAPDLRAVP